MVLLLQTPNIFIMNIFLNYKTILELIWAISTLLR